MSTTKTTREAHTTDWRALALGLRDGDPDAVLLATWAETREREEHEQSSLVRHAMRGLHAAFGEFCRETGTAKTDAERYRLCAETLGLRRPLATCNALPIAQLTACARRFRDDAQAVNRQREAAADLESLDHCAPPERELEFAA